MKTILIQMILVLMVTTISFAKDYGNLEDVSYVKNYDGDTITFNIPSLHPIIGDKISIRVNGIDTPEKRGKCQKEKDLAIEAKMFVMYKLSNADSIVLKDIQRGKYFRIVANVIVDGEDLSEMMIDNGFAVRYDGGTKVKDWCE